MKDIMLDTNHILSVAEDGFRFPCNHWYTNEQARALADAIYNELGLGWKKYIPGESEPEFSGDYICCAVFRCNDETEDEYRPFIIICDSDEFNLNNVTHWHERDMPMPPDDWWEAFEQLNKKE